MQGWIKLHRKIRGNPIFNDHQLMRLWLICLTEASHKERDQIIGKQTIKLMPGEFVTGRYDITEMYNNGLKPKDKIKGDKTVFRWLETLEKGGFLTIKKTNKFSVVSVDNWDIYQDNDQQKTDEMTNKRPSNDHQMTTNKNVKNVENEKKEIKTINHKFEICDMENAKLLFELMRGNNPDAKEPNFEKWADEFRKIRLIDGRPLNHIIGLIKWSQAHEFWHTNILSPSKLRKQWGQLILKAKQEKEQKERLKLGTHQKNNNLDWENA